MTVSVYPNKLDGGPIEEHATDSRLTILAWLEHEVKGYDHSREGVLTIKVNGELIAQSDWDSKEFSPSDQVHIYIEPKGAELIIAAVTIAAAATFLTGLLVPKLPSQDKSSQQQGRQLSDSAVKGNQVRLNTPIREVSGRRKIYPDYLLPLHRYFSAPRDLWSEMLLCVGKGEFEIPDSRVLVGDTPVISLGDDAEVRIYQPGASLLSEPAAVWWHTAPEVGSTNTGKAGIELRATIPVQQPVIAPATAIYDGDTITIPMGAGSFPDDWEAGMICRIDVKYPYTVTDGGGAARDIITGDMDQLALDPGDAVEITGPNAGFYFVDTIGTGVSADLTLDYSDSSPANALQLGSLNMCIGWKGLRYRILSAGPQVITVERLTDTGATDGDWPGFSLHTSYDSVIALDGSSLEGDWSGPFAACPDGEKTSYLEWDVMFPGGLGGVANDGSLLDIVVVTELQYRDMDVAGAWTSVQRVYQGRAFDQIGFTEQTGLPYPMRPEVRMRRIGADDPNSQIADTVQWYGLRCPLPAPTKYDGVTVIALRVKGGTRIAAQTEQLVSVEATRKLPVIQGSGFSAANEETRDIAAWVAYVAQNVGYTLDDIDIAELVRLHSIWKPRGDNFDAAYEGSSTVKQVLSEALAAGFSELTIDRGLIRPVRDEPRTTYEQMYTPQNMREPLQRQFKSFNIDDFDGVDVEYTDENTWQIETVQCRLPGDLGRRVEVMKINGVTNRTKAWRMGMRQRRAQKYRRNTFSFTTEMDAFNSRYLSFCAIGDDVPGYGQSAILLSVTPVTGGFELESSEPFDLPAGGIVAIRKQDGTLSGPYAATQTGDFTVQVGALDFTPDTSWTLEPPHLLFGTSTRWSYPVLITEVSPDGKTGASVTASNYNVLVYADDDNEPPA